METQISETLGFDITLTELTPKKFQSRISVVRAYDSTLKVLETASPGVYNFLSLFMALQPFGPWPLFLVS
jgi:hypothetical protein